MAGTRPRSIKTEETETFPRIIHEIDQLGWYRDIMSRILEKDEDSDEKILNSIRFNLPYSPGKDALPYFVVVGNGYNLCEAYMVRVNWGMDMLTGGIPEEKSRLWKIFSYSEKRDFNNGENLNALREDLPSKLGNIFITDISPFLKRTYYPLECDRIYDFSLWQSDKLRVIARNRKNRDEQNLEMIWVPDKRDGEPETIVILPNLKWTSSLDIFPFTDEFTFPDSVNIDSL